GAVIRHLTTAVDGNHFDVAGIEHVFGLAILALGKNRRVTEQPQRVRCAAATLLRIFAHGLPDGAIGLWRPALFVYMGGRRCRGRRGGHYSDMTTASWSVRS